MARYGWITNTLPLLALATVAAGCRHTEPQATPTDAPAAAAESSSSAASNSSTSASPPAQAQAATSPSPAPAGSLRDIVGRLLVSDADGTWRIDEKAATDLEAAAPSAEDLAALIRDSDVRVRQGAAYQLQSKFNPGSESEAATIAALLDDDDRIVRSFGLAGLNQMRHEDQVEAVPRLASLLDPKREDRPANRATMARFLGRLRSEAAGAVEQLAKSAAADPEAQVRAASLAALAQVAGPAEVLPQLARSLSDGERSVRIVAAARLRQLGASAAPAAKELAAALGDEDEGVRNAAAEALIRIGEPAARPLADVLGSGSPDARKLALACLARVGPLAKEALPAIEKAKKDGDPTIRQLAESAAARVAGRQ